MKQDRLLYEQMTWKENAKAWRDAYVRVRDEAGIGDTAEIVKIEGQFRRMAEYDANVAEISQRPYPTPQSPNGV